MLKTIDTVLAANLEAGDQFKENVHGLVTVTEVVDEAEFYVVVFDEYDDEITLFYTWDTNIELVVEDDDND